MALNLQTMRTGVLARPSARPCFSAYRALPLTRRTLARCDGRHVCSFILRLDCCSDFIFNTTICVRVMIRPSRGSLWCITVGLLRLDQARCVISITHLCLYTMFCLHQQLSTSLQHSGSYDISHASTLLHSSRDEQSINSVGPTCHCFLEKFAKLCCSYSPF
jgi:hypothetical protein